MPGFVGSSCPVDHVCSTCCTVRANFAKFGLHAGNMNFNTKNEDWIIICTIIIFLLYFSIRNVQCRYSLLIIVGKLRRNVIHNIGQGVFIFSTYLQIEFLISSVSA